MQMELAKQQDINGKIEKNSNMEGICIGFQKFRGADNLNLEKDFAAIKA